MKKSLFLTLTCVLLLGFTACKKDQQGTFGEGVYQPEYRIATIASGSATTQTWEWGTSKLSSIRDAENHSTYSFSYAGNQLSNVVITPDDNSTESQSIAYTYSGDQLTRMVLTKGTLTAITMTVSHNANDQISNVNVDISDGYLIQLGLAAMSGNMQFLQPLSYMVGPQAAQAITQMARCLPSSDRKLGINNKHFEINYTWDGHNIASETLSGNVKGTATIDDASDALDLGSISNILQYIASDTEFPFEATVQRTIRYTYDEKNNPTWYLWSSGFSAANLSRNNMLSSTATGGAEIEVNITIPESVPFMGGMNYPYTKNIDMSGNTTYSYTYNKKHYPATYTTSANNMTYTINYK